MLGCSFCEQCIAQHREPCCSLSFSLIVPSCSPQKSLPLRLAHLARVPSPIPYVQDVTKSVTVFACSIGNDCPSPLWLRQVSEALVVPVAAVCRLPGASRLLPALRQVSAPSSVSLQSNAAPWGLSPNPGRLLLPLCPALWSQLFCKRIARRMFSFLSP